jgi:hypothetical protein
MLVPHITLEEKVTIGWEEGTRTIPLFLTLKNGENLTEQEGDRAPSHQHIY